MYFKVLFKRLSKYRTFTKCVPSIGHIRFHALTSCTKHLTLCTYIYMCKLFADPPRSFNRRVRCPSGNPPLVPLLALELHGSYAQKCPTTISKTRKMNMHQDRIKFSRDLEVGFAGVFEAHSPIWLRGHEF